MSTRTMVSPAGVAFTAGGWRDDVGSHAAREAAFMGNAGAKHTLDDIAAAAERGASADMPRRAQTSSEARAQRNLDEIAGRTPPLNAEIGSPAASFISHQVAAWRMASLKEWNEAEAERLADHYDPLQRGWRGAVVEWNSAIKRNAARCGMDVDKYKGLAAVQNMANEINRLRIELQAAHANLKDSHAT